MSNIVNEINAENILMDVVKLNRLELIGELKMGIYEASYLSFDSLVDLVVSKELKNFQIVLIRRKNESKTNIFRSRWCIG